MRYLPFAHLRTGIVCLQLRESFFYELPELVLGIALLSYFTFIGLKLSLGTVILAHIVFSTPYVILIMNSRFHNFDWAIEEAARDLGANAFERFRYVLFPLIRPSMIGAMLLVFAISFDEFVVTYFVIGPQSTMPMKSRPK